MSGAQPGNFFFDGLGWGLSCRGCIWNLSWVGTPWMTWTSAGTTRMAGHWPSISLLYPLSLSPVVSLQKSSRTSCHGDSCLPRAQGQNLPGLPRLCLEQPQCQFCNILLVTANHRSAQIQRGETVSTSLYSMAENVWPSLIHHESHLYSPVLWNKGASCYLIILFSQAHISCFSFECSTVRVKLPLQVPRSAACTSLPPTTRFSLITFSPPHSFLLFMGFAPPWHDCPVASAAIKVSSMQKRVNTEDCYPKEEDLLVRLTLD